MIVYKAINTINNKVYIGITTKSLEHRMKVHKRDSKRMNTYFYKAIRKYGFDKFKWEIIDTALSINQLHEKEKYHILKHNSFDNKELGYNTTSGGGSMYNITKSEKESRSKRAKGINNPMYGKPGIWAGKKFSDEHKNNLSESLKGKNKGKLKDGNNPSAKKVINLSTGQIYDTIRLAEKENNISNGVLNSVLKRKNKFHGNHYWDYVDNVNLEKIELKEVDFKKRHKKRVLCITTGTVYGSILEASRKLGCCRKSIRNSCNHNTEYKGMFFEYII